MVERGVSRKRLLANMSAALEIPRNENHPQTEEKQEEAIKEEILIRPEEYQKLNSFSDILIKLFYQL